MKKLLPAFIIFLVSAFVLLSTTRSATAVLAGHVVISEVQVTGETSSADFVELYNPTGTTVDLADYRLVKRTASGESDSSIVAFQSGDSIAPYSYFLWCNTELAEALSCDSSTSGTVSNNNSIGLREGSLDAGVLIDAVTIGQVAHPLGEGEAVASAPDAHQSIERLPGETNPTKGNGEDTNNNSTDFTLRMSAQPQNTQSPAEQADTISTITNSPSPTDEETPTLTDTITPSASPTATMTPTATPSSTPTGDHVVISEVQIGGSVATDEFVELYNPTATPVDITGWELWRKTAEGTEFMVLATLNGSIPGNGHYLIAHEEYDGIVSADVSYADTALSANNTVQLVNDSDEYVDKVGMGSAQDFEGVDTASSPANDRSIERKAQSGSTGSSLASGGADEFAGNGYDTDNNDADFVLRPNTAGSDPQNTASAPENSNNEPSLTPTVTESPTPSASPSATMTPTDTPTVTVSPTQMPTPTPPVSPTPTPFRRIIGIFPMSRRVCFLEYEVFEFGFYRFFFPRISCEVV